MKTKTILWVLLIVILSSCSGLRNLESRINDIEQTIKVDTSIQVGDGFKYQSSAVLINAKKEVNDTLWFGYTQMFRDSTGLHVVIGKINDVALRKLERMTKEEIESIYGL